jgi:hypothetical protein
LLDGTPQLHRKSVPNILSDDLFRGAYNSCSSFAADAAESVARTVEHTTNSAQPSSVTFSLHTAKGTCCYDSLEAAQVVPQIRDDGRGMSDARLPEQPGDWVFVGVGNPRYARRLRQNGGRLEILANHQGTTIIATPIQAGFAQRGGR